MNLKKLVSLFLITALCFANASAFAFASDYSKARVIECEGEHSWYYYDLEKESCTSGWNEIYYCHNCYQSKEVPVTPTGHVYGDWELYYSASCTEEGRLSRTCKECYNGETKSTPATGHSYGEWFYEEGWEPTCEDEGILQRECSKCGNFDLKDVPATGHSYKTTTTKASPSKNGKTVKKCKNCGDVDSSTTIYRPKKIKLSVSEYTYNGKAKKPTVKVYNSNGAKISSDQYKVTYAKGRTKIGKYKVTVTFKNSSKKYKGSFSTTFKINPQKTSVTSLTKGTKSFTVKWKKKTTQVNGYQIRYSRNSNMSNASKKLITSNKTTSKKITGLKAGKKYYVQVRTYKMVNGVKYYSAWSTKKSITTKKSSSGGSSGSNNGSSNGNGNTSGGGKVYYTETGSKYHHDAGCRGLNNADKIYSTSLSQAKAWGLTLCGWED